MYLSEKVSAKGPLRPRLAAASLFKINVIIEDINHVSSSPVERRPRCTLCQIDALNILSFSFSLSLSLSDYSFKRRQMGENEFLCTLPLDTVAIHARLGS